MSAHFYPSGLTANAAHPPGILYDPSANTRPFGNPIDISHVPEKDEIPDDAPHILLSLPRHTDINNMTDIRLRISLTDDDQVSAAPINFPAKRSATAAVDPSLVPPWGTHVHMGPAVTYYLRRAVDAALCHLPSYHRSSRRKYVEDTAILLGDVLLQGHAWYAVAIGPATGVTRGTWDMMKPFLTDGRSIWMAFRNEDAAHEWLNAIKSQLGTIRAVTRRDELVAV